MAIRQPVRGSGQRVCSEFNYLLAVNFLQTMEDSLKNSKIHRRK